MRWIRLAGMLVLAQLGIPGAAADDAEIKAASALLFGGKVDAAIERFSAIIAKGGLPPAQLALAHSRRGEAYNHKGKLTEALDEFQRARSLSPDDALLQLQFGRQHLTLAERGRQPARIFGHGNLQAARAALAEAVRLDPRLDSASSALGRISLHFEDYPEALAKLEDSLGLSPHWWVTWQDRAVALRGLRRPDEEAIASLRTAYVLFGSEQTRRALERYDAD
ncbi:MAG: hypothetical protein C3F17_19640 [Bradyrhizobiaceae bacterium]|nr:MAG: hypothetical protein C3F17_19640 [Bradyrhizobiaceae bacterium]